jgi:hypothetical protein
MWELIAAGAVAWTVAGGGVVEVRGSTFEVENTSLELPGAAEAPDRRSLFDDFHRAHWVEPGTSNLAPRTSNLEARTSNTDAPRSPALTAMYVTFGALQVADIHSTSRALSNGAVEGNPAMRAVVGNRAAFIAVKAAGGATTILVSEKLRKKHPVAAFVLMASLNGFLAAVVAHNYGVR